MEVSSGLSAHACHQCNSENNENRFSDRKDGDVKSGFNFYDFLTGILKKRRKITHNLYLYLI